MLKKNELSNPKSCINRAAPDEMVFVLRANDPMAARTVRYWATISTGVHESSKVADAFATADDMAKHYAKKMRQEHGKVFIDEASPVQNNWDVSDVVWADTSTNDGTVVIRDCAGTPVATINTKMPILGKDWNATV